MAFRNDVSINWEVSPRIILVAAPSVEITIQDLHDTLRTLEAQTEAMDDPAIVDTAGKEPLGGGVYVGLTLTLLNAVIAFEPRTGPEYTQCDIIGGNAVARDAFGGEISPVHPTAFTQIVRTSSSSATLQELSAIQYSSFGGGVSIDVLSGYSGTEFPLGTVEHPVNNVVDARLIAEYRGFNTFFIRGDITLGAGDDVSSFLLVGDNAARTAIIIEAASDTNNIEIRNAWVTGYLDNGIIARDCIVEDLFYVNGVLFNCMINPGTITFGNGATGYMLDCYSGVPGSDTPTFDLGGAGQALAVRGYSGGIKIINRTGTDPISLDFLSGQFVADSTITNGTIVVRGVAKVTDNSTGTAVIDDSNVVNPYRIADQVWDEVEAEHVVGGSMGEALTTAHTEATSSRKISTNKAVIAPDDKLVTIYDDDGIAILYQFNISDDKRTRTPV